MDNTNNAAAMRAALQKTHNNVKKAREFIAWQSREDELLKEAQQEIKTALTTPSRNCDRADIQTPWDAVMAWLDATDPEYAALVRELEGDWEPARYEWEQIVKWLLSPTKE